MDDTTILVYWVELKKIDYAIKEFNKTTSINRYTVDSVNVIGGKALVSVKRHGLSYPFIEKEFERLSTNYES